jgi:type III pantothenate kinase
MQVAGLKAGEISGAIISSVVPPLTPVIEEVCRSYFGQAALVVGPGLKTGMPILYENPLEVGADRITASVAAYEKYGGPAIVVDFGTATTFDAVSAKGEYLGGAIAPGIGIAADALVMRTAKLPRVDLQRPPSAIGRNTPHAMQSGLLFGYVGLVEGMVSRFRKELGPKMKVIATGGLAEVVAHETDVLEIIAPWLTLDGLRIIWELNQAK